MAFRCFRDPVKKFFRYVKKLGNIRIFNFYWISEDLSRNPKFPSSELYDSPNQDPGLAQVDDGFKVLKDKPTFEEPT